MRFNGNGKRFNAEPEQVEKLNKEQTKQIIGIVIGVVVLILAFVFGNLQNETYDRSERDLYNALKIGCIIFGLVELVFSPIVLFFNQSLERNLAQTHVTLYDDGIEGVYFDNGSCFPFEVSYADVSGAVTASALIENGITLKIKTEHRTYNCYAIEQSSRVAKLINEAVANYAAKAEESVNTGVTEAADTTLQPHDGIFCVYCGTKLPSDAAFCSACGKQMPNDN